jgi:hypothetical protein
MARRSRSLHPQKARPSEAPSQDEPIAQAAPQVDARSREPETAAPIDEMAALDAGWDKLVS